MKKSNKLSLERTYLAYKRTFLTELKTNSIFLGISLLIFNFYKKKFTIHHKLFILIILSVSSIIYLITIYAFYLVSVEHDTYSISAYIFAFFLILFNLLIMVTIYRL